MSQSDVMEGAFCWGWNFEKQRWFPCLSIETRECVTAEGVIVFATTRDRDARRDELLANVRAAIADETEEPA